jgi:hypothetical protein
MTTATLRSCGSLFLEMPALRAAALVLTALAASLLHLGSFLIGVLALVVVHAAVARREYPKRAGEVALMTSLPAIAFFLLAAVFSLYMGPLRAAVIGLWRPLFTFVMLAGSAAVFCTKWALVRMTVSGLLHPRVQIRAKRDSIRVYVIVICACLAALALSPLILGDMAKFQEFFVKEFLVWTI